LPHILSLHPGVQMGTGDIQLGGGGKLTILSIASCLNLRVEPPRIKLNRVLPPTPGGIIVSFFWGVVSLEKKLCSASLFFFPFTVCSKQLWSHRKEEIKSNCAMKYQKGVVLIHCTNSKLILGSTFNNHPSKKDVLY